MMSKKPNHSKLYQRLYRAYGVANRHLNKKKIQEGTNALWHDLKQRDGVEVATELKIRELNLKATKVESSLVQFFTKASAISCCPHQPQPSALESDKENNRSLILKDCEPPITNFVKKIQETPAQDASGKKIAVMKSKLNSMLLARDSGIATDVENRDISKLKEEIKNEEISLKRKIDAVERQKKSRERKKRKLHDLCEKHSEVAQVLKQRKSIGRPKLEENQPELLRAITEIALVGGAADDRRRSEMIRSCRSLDDLHSELLHMGYEISRSGLYLRLIPKRQNSLEGKKHITTVPVKLCRPESSLHVKHQDGMFCTATMRNVESLASVLGPDQVFFLSMDDKARVPLGITAANAQAPILMHLQYKVTLPDHDFVVADRHKLIPSVYAAVGITKDGTGQPNAVTYSGPTYVAVRSGKHSSSNAETHAIDIETLSELSEFKPFVKNHENAIKPVFIITCDGGPDENPRYQRVIASAINHFKNFDLDAIFIATNAPGRSAFNRVERRMAPLSRELTGLILKHDTFGSHLDSSNKTIDEALEKKNFAEAGNVLCEIWNKLVIDGFSVTAKYISPAENEVRKLNVDANWYATHVRESQYFLQIVKCSEETCCGIRRSSLWRILKDGFLPPPVLVEQTSAGYKATEVGDTTTKFSPLLLQLVLNLKIDSKIQPCPYDYYCPSVQSHLVKRSCSSCGLYFASYKSATNHLKLVHKESGSLPKLPEKKIRPQRIAAKRAKELLCLLNEDENAVWIDEGEVDPSLIPNDITNYNDEESGMQVITNIKDWCVSPWTEEK